MRTQRALGLMLVAAIFLPSPAAARAQGANPVYLDPYRPGGAYAAPGNYGMAYGSMSAGVPRTYTTFTSPYGAGYSYGYAPPSFLPGPYGVGLWRAGLASPGYAFGAYSYRTFAVPYRPGAPDSPVPVGYYAPGFGPPSPLSYPPPDMGW